MSSDIAEEQWQMDSFRRAANSMREAAARVQQEDAVRGGQFNRDTYLTTMVRAQIIGHLNAHVLPNRERIDEIFTLMALVYGPPDWRRTIAWVDMLEQALDIPTNTFAVAEGNEWLRTYEKWYGEQA